MTGTNKILVAGGFSWRYKYDDTTEIIDTDDGSVTMGGSMKIGRVGHGMGTIMVKGEQRLVVFGGVNKPGGRPVSVEVYDAKKDQWELAEFTLENPRFDFGYVTV